MHFYSTKNKSDPASFATAALTGLAPDGGLYIPQTLPVYPDAVRSSLGTMNFCDLAFETIRLFVHDDIPDPVLEDIVQTAYPFRSTLVAAGDRLILELFHGPTAAFKDFGARFMARSFAYLRRSEDKPLHILVATSGDTGGAVADGFFGVEGISVTVLYPHGRVSPLQERQISGLGGNIRALAVEGSFDDCQRLVKTAFADASLKKRLSLSSANSINISRLIPQTIYYSFAAGKICAGNIDEDIAETPRKAGFSAGYKGKSVAQPVICVPCGNFGNLTAGLYAYKMGAPIAGFIAATNSNRTVPDYLANGVYKIRLSRTTLSNAMDVGAPSNFERMKAHFSLKQMRAMMSGVSISDEQTRAAIAGVYEKEGYFLDPHTAVAWKASDEAIQEGGAPVVVLSTAHPAKFTEIVKPLTGPIPIPQSISAALARKPSADKIPADFSALLEKL
ncbi:MAG: threonine synthase [Spirochaetaceae bacterium]|jgi:threonine synthase|nr:threonine synthase [Spirochaetaceae bacterium]